MDKVTSLITYAYFKKNHSHSNDNRKEPTSSNALSISSTMTIPKKRKRDHKSRLNIYKSELKPPITKL